MGWTRMEGKKNAYSILVGKSYENRKSERSISRWLDNIKIYLREKGWGGMDWINLAPDMDRWRALENTVMKLRVP
jgi:hypothetical protein